MPITKDITSKNVELCFIRKLYLDCRLHMLEECRVGLTVSQVITFEYFQWPKSALLDLVLCGELVRSALDDLVPGGHMHTTTTHFRCTTLCNSAQE